MIIKSSPSRSYSNTRRSINANTSVTSGVRNRNYTRRPQQSILGASALNKLTPEQRMFARQLQNNMRKSQSVMAATNTSNIAARPEFMELLPLFVQKLLILDVFGSVAMKSRQQLIPYFKVKTENTKGETAKGTVLSSPFVNAQGSDPTLTSRIVKNETVVGSTLQYIPVLPGSVILDVTPAGGAKVNRYIDDGSGGFVDDTGAVVTGAVIDYASGLITGVTGSSILSTYQYDNETIGPDADGVYGAKMAKIDLQLDEINMIAEAHEVACYYSIYAAFAAQQEYGANINDLAKDAAFSELTAEINSQGFAELAKAASYRPQFNWDASPVLAGAVVPSDYLNMFKLKLSQAAASVYQQTRLTRPNRLIVGSTTGAYIEMINSFQSEKTDDNVGPYKLGKLDQFDVYVDPNYDPNAWVMACKSNDIRRNSGLFGEYMPLTATDPIGLADMSTQSGFASMYSIKVVNPLTVVSGKVIGTF